MPTAVFIACLEDHLSPLRIRAGNKLGILQVNTILFVIAAGRKLGIAERGQVPCLGPGILHPDTPDFIGFVEWNIVQNFCLNTGIFR